MSLKTKYILFVSFTLLAFAALTALLYQYNKYLFLAGEGIIVVTIVLSVIFYKSIIRPYKLLHSGIESIADKDFSIKFLPVGQPEPDRLIEVYNKMIDQLRLERINATETHFFLQKLIEASPTGIIIIGKDDAIENANPAARNILSIPGGEGIKLSSLKQPWKGIMKGLEENSTEIVQENGIKQYKCYRSVFLDRGVKRTFFLIEELTKELLSAERKAYEKVIRMISHEVNNSMGAVNSILDSTTQYIKYFQKEKTPDFVDALEVAKQRISNLNSFTKRFTEVVRIPPPEKRKCDLVEKIKEQLVYFHAEFKMKNISIETSFDVENLAIEFDIQQLELVLANILKNAIQAIESEGTISVYATPSPVSLRIENNGVPIKNDIREKLFTPFFTTKKTGQGIGLTLIREILLNHDCQFSLDTREDEITEFRIVFDENS